MAKPVLLSNGSSLETTTTKQRPHLSIYQGPRTVASPQRPSPRSRHLRMAARLLGRHPLTSSYNLIGHVMARRPTIQMNNHHHLADRLIGLKSEWMGLNAIMNR